MKLVVLASLLAVAATVASAGFYDKSSNVVNLDKSNFDKEVLQSDDVWIVEFYAPWCGHCKNLIPEYKKAATALKGHIKMGAVDATADTDLGNKYNVDGFPTIKVFGKDKNAPSDYQGGRRASDFIATARKELNALNGKEIPKLEEEKASSGGSGGGFYEGTDVVELTDESFEKEVLGGSEPWLVEFYAPWCGHCKALAPEWKKAATELGGAVRIGAVDATVHTKYSNQYKVQGFPTIKFFPPGGAEPEEYNGPRAASGIVEYCMKKAELYPGKPVEVKQFANQEEFQALASKKTIVGVFIVPHVIDTGAAGRNKMIEMFGEVASKLRGKSIGFGWIVGGEHIPFEEAVGIQVNYPAFVMINEKKMRYAQLRGAFTQDVIVSTIRKHFENKMSTSALKELPKLSSGVPLWDGEDYKPSDDE